jgi:diguanylate cyclase (GGDEF)-like protein
MSRSPFSAATQEIKSEKIQSFMPSIDDSAALPSINTHKISDLDSALSVLGEAERLIQVQRKRIAYLESLALNDEVTSVMNRRGFMGALQRELAAAKRDQQASGIIIMFDLDNFKTINDIHGHPAGDAYLAAFAAALMHEVRPTDIVARLGGDEFAVLMTRVALKPGMARAATITKSINGKSISWRNAMLPFQTSSGVAAYTGRDIAEAVMVSADLKLYADKQKRKAGQAKKA